MLRRLAAFLTALGALVVLSGVVGLQADTPATNVGKKIANFELKDVAGRTVSLGDFKEKKAVVVVFVGTECPINNYFMPTLKALHAEYAAKGVQFLAVNSNWQDTGERVARHAKKHEIPFPVLKDEGGKIADLLEARRTPEAFLLDADRKLRYQGRIDDQYGVGYQRPKPTRRDLALAIDEVLAGKEVSQATAPVAGCLIARQAKPKKEGQVTYAKDVAPILQKNCQECHRPGQIGPFSLLTYDDAAAWAGTIHEVVSEGRMPPWYADPKHGKFSNDRRLSAEEKATLLSWIDQGAPRGEDKDLPAPRKFETAWTIGKPDLVIEMPKEFDVPAVGPKNGIEYQYFSVKTDFKEDRWVVRAEARPGAPEVVHHIIVFVVPPKGTFIPQAGNAPVLTGTAPGDMVLILKPGLAKKIPAGAELVFQMHYTPNGRAQKDRSSLGLIFAKEPPEREVHTIPIANPNINIPAGADNHQIESRFTFYRDGRILSCMPHMHLRGKDFTYEVTYPDGKKEVILSVPRFNFAWQGVYRFAEPPAMPKGTKIRCVAHFDNSTKNPSNPDPTKKVYWGDQTWEEMMIGWTDVIFDAKPGEKDKGTDKEKKVEVGSKK